MPNYLYTTNIYIMKQNHFIFGYAGNKRNEVKIIQDNLQQYYNFENIKTIIEPFCGSSAYSFYLSTIYPKKFKYILNDNNQFLIELYQILKNENETNILINEMKTIMVDITKEKYINYIKENENNYKGYLLANFIYRLRPGFFPIQENFKFKSFDKILDYPIIKFLKDENIEFSNIDGIEIIEKYKNDKSVFLFIDPPYLISCNSFYKSPTLNVYEYLYNNSIRKMKSNICLVLEKTWIINLLFQNCKKIEYDKIYQTNKKKTTHLLIINK